MKITDSKYKQCLYFTSGALARKVEKLAIESWKKVNLAPSHAYLLMLVLDHPGIQPGELAEELQLSPSTITRLIEKLEDKKMLVRTTAGKITNVYPTPRAKEMQTTFKECIDSFYENYVQILGREESGRFIRNMNKVTEQLK